MSALQFVPGKFYRTLDGRKGFLFEVGDFLFGKLLDYGGTWWPMRWGSNGHYNVEGGNDADLIAEWSDKPEVDWSVMPAWANWVAMDTSGAWFWHVNKPEAGRDHWSSDSTIGPRWGLLPLTYCPKWSGDWRDSLVERPKGGAK